MKRSNLIKSNDFQPETFLAFNEYSLRRQRIIKDW